VNGQAQTGVVVDPPSVLIPLLRQNAAGAELTRLKVFTRTGQIHLLGAVVEHPSMRAETTAVEPGRSYDLVLRLNQPLPAGPFQTLVRISTDDPQAPVMEVQVEGAAP